MRTSTISTLDAAKIAVRVGKKIIDKQSDGKKITLDEVRDIFESSIPRKFIPMITDDQREFHKCCEKYGISEELEDEVNKSGKGITFVDLNAEGACIYIPKNNFDMLIGKPGGIIGHELLHALYKKTVEGRKKLRGLQKLLKKGVEFEPETTLTGQSINIKKLLVDAMKIRQLARNEPEACKLHRRLQTEQRKFAYIRTILRTIFDPRLKKEVEKDISKSNLSIEKSVNPDSIAVRPTVKQIDILVDNLKEESMAYLVSHNLYTYSRTKPSAFMMWPFSPYQITSKTFAKASTILKSEKEILAKNSQ